MRLVIRPLFLQALLNCGGVCTSLDGCKRWSGCIEKAEVGVCIRLGVGVSELFQGGGRVDKEGGSLGHSQE